jgi:hypothetical protein
MLLEARLKKSCVCCVAVCTYAKLSGPPQSNSWDFISRTAPMSAAFIEQACGSAWVNTFNLMSCISLCVGFIIVVFQ